MILNLSSKPRFVPNFLNAEIQCPLIFKTFIFVKLQKKNGAKKSVLSQLKDSSRYNYSNKSAAGVDSVIIILSVPQRMAFFMLFSNLCYLHPRQSNKKQKTNWSIDKLPLDELAQRKWRLTNWDVSMLCWHTSQPCNLCHTGKDFFFVCTCVNQ